MKLEEFIKYLEKRPQMYFDEISVESLYDFLTGYFIAKEINNILDTDDNSFLNDFHPYLKKRLNISRNNWKDLLIEKYNGDDKEAFFKFFKYFNAFTIKNNS